MQVREKEEELCQANHALAVRLEYIQVRPGLWSIDSSLSLPTFPMLNHCPNKAEIPYIHPHGFL